MSGSRAQTTKIRVVQKVKDPRVDRSCTGPTSNLHGVGWRLPDDVKKCWVWGGEGERCVIDRRWERWL